MIILVGIQNTIARKKVFSAHSRDELQRAVYDCCRDKTSSEDNRPTRLHGPIGKWDVSQVTNMSKIFRGLKFFNYTLSNWDVSRVTDMKWMFYQAKSFNQDLSKWDVSRVTDMDSMFRDAISFQQTLCGAAWVKSKASQVDMFTRSLGSISDTVCRTWVL